MAMFRIELEHTDWQTVLNTLGSRPYVEVAQLIGKISQQLQVGPVAPKGNGEQIHKEMPRDQS